MLEVIDKGSSTESHPVPLLFVHGTWHAAWCWDEHFLDFFADKGYRAVALSLRGHGVNRPGESGVSGTSRRGSARLQPSHLTVGMPCDVVPTTLGRCIFRLLHHEERRVIMVRVDGGGHDGR